jgi:hypothetical protein
MFAKSPGDVVPITRKGIGANKNMDTSFLTDNNLLIASDLLMGQKYSQDYFISDILPEFEGENITYKQRRRVWTFSCT